MAKVQNSAVKWITAGLTVAVIFAAIVGTWTVYGKDIEDNAEGVVLNTTAVEATKKEVKRDIRHLERNGCKPAGENSTSVMLIQKDIETIQTDQADLKTEMKVMRTEQKASFREILRRLPTK